MSMHVRPKKKLKGIRSDKRLDDLISEIVFCNFDMMCLQECWRVDAGEYFETERALTYLSGGGSVPRRWCHCFSTILEKKSYKLVSMPTIPVIWVN